MNAAIMDNRYLEDKVAARYAKLYSEMADFVLLEQYAENEAIRKAGFHDLSSFRVVDIGCGEGRVCRRLVSEWGAHHVVGCDASAAFIEIAQAQEGGDSPIAYHVCSMLGPESSQPPGEVRCRVFTAAAAVRVALAVFVRLLSFGQQLQADPRNQPGCKVNAPRRCAFAMVRGSQLVMLAGNCRSRHACGRWLAGAWHQQAQPTITPALPDSSNLTVFKTLTSIKQPCSIAQPQPFERTCRISLTVSHASAQCPELQRAQPTTHPNTQHAAIPPQPHSQTPSHRWPLRPGALPIRAAAGADRIRPPKHVQLHRQQPAPRGLGLHLHGPRGVPARSQAE